MNRRLTFYAGIKKYYKNLIYARDMHKSALATVDYLHHVRNLFVN